MMKFPPEKEMLHIQSLHSGGKEIGGLFVRDPFENGFVYVCAPKTMPVRQILSVVGGKVVGYQDACSHSEDYFFYRIIR